MSSQQLPEIGDSIVKTDQGPSIQVIGVGLPRTDTKSFCAALEILLKGPVCHAGSTCMWREEDFIKNWISILYPTPDSSHGPLVTLLKQTWLGLFRTQSDAKPATKAEDAFVKATLRDLMSGYVAAADAPVLFFAGELAETYPEAKIICTIRDRDKWWGSYQGLVGALDQAGQDLRNLFRPTMRHYLSWKLGIVERRKAIYYPGFEVGPDFPDVHEHYLRSVVPADQLFFYNVQDEWGPLCKILGCPVPNEPFPHINEGPAVKILPAKEDGIGAGQWVKFLLTPFTACARLLTGKKD